MSGSIKIRKNMSAPGVNVISGYAFVENYWANRTPTDLIITSMRDTEIDFEWTDNSTGDTTFKIYKSTDGVNYSADGTTNAGDNTYTATGMAAGTVYYFYVVGYSGDLESIATNIYDTRFKITIDTTLTGSVSDTFILPNYTSGTYNYYVDWGEGGYEENITTTGTHSHTYAASGIYQIKIRGTFPQIYFATVNDYRKLTSIDNWGNIKWSSMNGAFYGCSNMVGNYIDTPNLSGVYELSNMFRSCVLFNSKVDNFNFSTIRITNSMFRGATTFNQSVNTWDVSALEAATGMFHSCYAFNQAVSNWNTSKIYQWSYMFYRCLNFNQSVSNFDTAKANDMMYMFRDCTLFNQDLSNFNTSLVTTMQYMLRACTAFKQSLATFSLAAATDLTYMLESSDINATGTTTNYDATLVAWAAATTTPNNLVFNGGTSKYSDTGQTARDFLTLAVGSGGKGWTITDGGHI